jgi:hypothetical protein
VKSVHEEEIQLATPLAQPVAGLEEKILVIGFWKGTPVLRAGIE